MTSSHNYRIPTTKIHTPSIPSIPSLEYCKQHSVLITAEDAQDQVKWLSIKINQKN